MNAGELMWQLQSSLWAALLQEDLHTTGWRLVGHSPQHISVAIDSPVFSCFPLCVDFLSSSLKEVPAQGTSVLLFNTTISREEEKEFYCSPKIKLQWSSLDRTDSTSKIIQTFLSSPLQACFLQLRHDIPALVQAKPHPLLHPFWAEILRRAILCQILYSGFVIWVCICWRCWTEMWTRFTEGLTWIPWSESVVLLPTELPLFVLNQILSPLKWKNAHFVFNDLLKLNASHNQQGLWN